MNSRNKAILRSPIIGRVIELNRYMLNKGQVAYKIVKHNYIDDMLKQGALLFKYARRQLLGKDYVKRTVELCEEIESQAYLVYALGGWNNDVAGNINVLTENIVKQIEAIGHSQNHEQ